MRTDPLAVVLSSDVIGLGAVRSLKAGRVPTIVVTLSRSEPVRFSRYAEKRVVPRSNDPEAALLAVLAGIPSPPRPVLIPTSDYLAHFIARHRDALAERFLCAVPADPVMELALDKAKDTALLAGYGVPMPKSAQVLPPTPGELVRRIGLPLIIKPRTYEDKRELGWRNVVAHRLEHVEEFYRTQRGVFGRVIGQELIPGDDEMLWECICVFDGNSDLVSAFTFRKLRTVPAHYGQTSYGRSERNEEIIALARDIGKRLGYTGPADIDLKYDARDGRYKYLELNPRVGLCNHFAARCGVNVVLDAYRVARGEPVRDTSQVEGVRFLSALEDMGGRLHDGDSPAKVLVDFVAALAKRPVGAYLAWDDPLPGPLSAARLVWRFLVRAWRGQLGHVFTRDYRKLPPPADASAGPGPGEVKASAPAPAAARSSTPAGPPVPSGSPT
jgi:predicted ATP-grasp superfamily ATP-dependent carboligase